MVELSREQIARRMGVSPQRVSQLTQRDDFPGPTQTRHGRRWSLADVQQWERRHRSKVVELFDVMDIAAWFSESWEMGGEPYKRILYLLQAHRIIQVAEHNGRALYDVSTVRWLWDLLIQIRPTDQRIQAESAAVERYRMSGVPQHVPGESSYWLAEHEASGNTGGLMSEAGEPPVLPARPVPEVDEGEDNDYE